MVIASVLMCLSSSMISGVSFLGGWPMSIYQTLLAVLIIGVASTALGQASVVSPETDTPEMGTPEQRQACGPDVRRYCKTVKPDDGPFAYLACLQEHRGKLRVACLNV